MKRFLLSCVLGVLISSLAFGATEIRQTGMYVNTGLGVSGDHRLGNTCVTSPGGRTYCGLNASHLSFFADNAVSLELLYQLALASDNGINNYCMKSAGDNTFYWGTCGPGTVTSVTGDSMIAVANGTTTPALSLNDNSITNAKMQFDDLGNVGFGDNVFSALTTGYSNVAIGFDTQNFNSTGRENISLGHSALRSSTNAWRNVALGARALYSATTARNNYAFGDDSQYFNQTGRYNISIGPETLRDNISSYYSIAIGFETLIYALAEKNIGIGRQALFSDDTGTLNVAIGDAALYNNTTGSYNVAVGAATGNSLVGGSSQIYGTYNTWVGYNARPSTDNQTNSTALGNGAVTTDNNQVSLGDNNVTSFLLGGQSLSRTELSYLSGVTSAIQTQLNNKYDNGTITITSGVYTPTVTDNTNVDSAVTVTQAQYLRVGSVVTVSGRFTADPTLAASTTFQVTLPVTSNLGAAEDLAGDAASGGVAGLVAEVTGEVTNNTAKVVWVAVDLTSKSWSYTYTYRVI